MLVVVVRVLPASSWALVMICTRTFLRRRRMAAFSLVRRVVMVLVWPPSIANVWFFTKTMRRGVRSRLHQCHSPFMVEAGHLERVRIVEDSGPPTGATATTEVMVADA